MHPSLRSSARLGRTLAAHAALTLAAALTPPATMAAQQGEITLQASQVTNLLAFRIDANGAGTVDGFTPTQTGSVSSNLLATSGGVSALLSGNPLATVGFTYDPLRAAPVASNAVFAAFSGGSSVSISLPNGIGSGALVFDNSAGPFSFTGLANNAAYEAGGVSVLLPGASDAVLFGTATGAFTNAGLTVNNPAGLVSKVNLLADPQFVATYVGPSLPTLPSLVVTLQHPTTLRLNDPSLQFLDAAGAALSSLDLPPSLSFASFASARLLMPFEGAMGLSLDAADYASAADLSNAQSWLAASGLASRAFSRQVAVWELTTAVPQPSSALLLALGLVVLGIAVRRAPRRAPVH